MGQGRGRTGAPEGGGLSPEPCRKVFCLWRRQTDCGGGLRLVSSGSGRAEEVLSRLPDPYKYWAGFQLQAGGGGSYFTALPIMWGPTGSHLKGEGCHSIWTSENCALSMSFQISLVRWQPSPKRIQVGSKTRCHRKALLSRGSATCSQKNSTPPWEGGRRELRPLLSSILLCLSHLPSFSDPACQISLK